MIYQESNRVRRIVGRLERGDDCVDELSEFCKEHDIEAGEVRAVGRLSEVEVVRFDPEANEYRPVFDGEGNFDLLNLTGNVSRLGDEVVVRLQSVLSADGPVGPQVITGQLRSGRVLEFEFVLEVFEDLELERRLDGETGLLTLQSIRRRDVEEAPEPEPEKPAESIGGKSMSWGDAAEASKEAKQQESEPSETRDESIYEGIDLEEPLLEAGDVLDHPKLGKCTVMKVEDDKYAHIRLPKGKIRKLSLNVVDVRYKGEEEGRNVFEAQVGK